MTLARRRPGLDALIAGLKMSRASDLPDRPRPAPSTPAPPSRFERQAAKEFGAYAVAIIGHASRVGRYPGDNAGAQCFRVVASMHGETNLAHDDDLKQPLDEHRMVEHAKVYVRTEADMRQMKAALERLLHGNMDPARFSWRSLGVETDISVLPMLMGEAATEARVLVYDGPARALWIRRRAGEIERRAGRVR